MSVFFKDIKFSLRQLVKSPVFAIVAVLSLALGIGANTAIFSLLNAVLLRTLPVPYAKELRVVDFDASQFSYTSFHGGNGSRPFPYPAYASFRDRAQGFEEIFAFSDLSNMTTVTPIGARTADGLMVSGNFFSGYGAQALIGRTLMPNDDRPGAAPVTVITYRAWERYFGAEPNALGHTVALNKAVFTIVGILPQSYVPPTIGNPVDFYVPLAASQPQLKPHCPLASAETWWVQIMARRDLDVSEAQAHASLDLLLRQFLETSQDSLGDPKILLKDGRRGLTDWQTAQPLWVLQALVAMLLFIACANLASLLLARGATRRHELAVRAALGAERRHLMHQALAESLLLSLCGAGLGLVFSTWMRTGLMHFLVPPDVATDLSVTGSVRVLLFALAAAVITTFLCGIIPAWQAGRVQPLAGLKDNRTQAAPRLRISRTLISMQMALSVLLVLGTGLLIQTLIHLRRADPGFDVENLLVFRINPGQAGYKGQELTNFYQQTHQTLAGIPGTRSVGFAGRRLLSGGMSGGGFGIPGRSDLTRSQTQAYMLTISDSFLETMGIPLLSGRHFNASDSPASGRVAIVNEAFARTFFTDQNVLGQHVTRQDELYEIIGLCRDAAYEDVRQAAPPTLYFPITQHMRGNITVTVRSVVPPMALVATVRKSLAQLDRNIPLEGVTTQRQIVRDSMSMERLFSLLCGILSGLALSLCCIGLYGLMAYNVARRTSEIGIRMAFGARPWDVARPILREALGLATLGVAIGIPLALVVTQLMRRAFYGVRPHDPLTVVASIALLLGVAVLAAWIPARRAAKIDPMEALRYE